MDFYGELGCCLTCDDETKMMNEIEDEEHDCLCYDCKCTKCDNYESDGCEGWCTIAGYTPSPPLTMMYCEMCGKQLYNEKKLNVHGSPLCNHCYPRYLWW